MEIRATRQPWKPASGAWLRFASHSGQKTPLRLGKLTTMADPVEDYQNRQLSTLNADIAAEGHNADWSSWFSSVPAADALRQQRNVTQLIADAVNRKQQILAETNEQAQR